MCKASCGSIGIRVVVLCAAIMAAAGCGGNSNVKDAPAAVPAKKAAAAAVAQAPAPAPAVKPDASTVSVIRPTQKRLMAPDFKLQDLRQDMVTLSEFRGNNPVLLFFWTTWCPFCQRELQVLKTSYPQLVQAGIEVLAINIGELSDRVSSAVDSYRLTYRVLLDKDESVASQYEVIGVPTYVLVNTEGEIVFQDNYFPSAYSDLVSAR
jgi:peroxiredoxin